MFFGDLGLTRIGKFVILHLLLSYLKSTLAYDDVDLIKNKIIFEFSHYNCFFSLLTCLSITLRLF